ncbi:MAG: hypothetical protein ACI4WS_14145 [Oscillospiraceae bacterium]
MPDYTSLLFSMVYTFTITAQICLGDFGDKTSYYEIMGGHTRLQVFWGRAIPCLVLGTLGALVLCVLPDITATIMLGWGNDIPAGEIILRRLMLIFPLFRISCEFVLIAFMLKNMVAVIVVGCVINMVGINLAMYFSGPWLGITTIPMLFNTDVWTTYGLDSEIHFSFGTAIEADVIVPVVVISLAAAALSLAMGYYYFKKDDMN